jgi:hypothetical protein
MATISLQDGSSHLLVLGSTSFQSSHYPTHKDVPVNLVQHQITGNCASKKINCKGPLRLTVTYTGGGDPSVGYLKRVTQKESYMYRS